LFLIDVNNKSLQNCLSNDVFSFGF